MRLAGAGTAAAALLLCLLRATADATDVQLWPLFRYHSDASGQRSVRLLGPLLQYESGPMTREFTFRPLFSYSSNPATGEGEFDLLYPIWISRWKADETKHSLVGLISFRAQSTRRPDEWEQRFTIFPLVFYRHSRVLGTEFAILPFYANLRDFFGYQRFRTVAFPFYLRLEQPLVQRTWFPFPFLERTGGTLGRGFRVWPMYGWEEQGEEKRFTYVLWPFYISSERHFTRPEREHTLVSFPLFSRIDAPGVRSRSVLGPFFTHTVDQNAHTETWGFPWPLWVSQRNLETGKRTSLRLAPFYGNSHLGAVQRGFVLWPAYRWQRQEDDSYQYHRRDVLLVLGRTIDELQPRYHHERHLRTMFPLLRATGEDRDIHVSTLSVLDALFPYNRAIARLYAPLWQLYSADRNGNHPARWSLLWDLVSSDGERTRYPVYLTRGR